MNKNRIIRFRVLIWPINLHKLLWALGKQKHVALHFHDINNSEID